MKIKITFLHQTKALFFLLLTLIFLFFGLLWFNFNKHMVLICSLLEGVQIILTLYLHITYYNLNKAEEYEVSSMGILNKKDNLTRFNNIHDIENIFIYMSPSVNKGSNFYYFPMESYHFARITFKNKEEIILTSLLHPNIEEVIKKLNIPYEKHERFLCTIGSK